MSALQVSAATLSSLINSNDNVSKPGDASAKKSGGDQFASLLDVVGNIGDSQNSPRRDEENDPQATVIEAPQAFRDPSTRKDAKEVNKTETTTKTEKREAVQPREKNDDDTAAPAENISFRAPSREAKSADKTTSSSDKPSAAAEVSEDEPAEEKSATPVDKISDLMAVVAQFLAGVLNVAGSSETKPEISEGGEAVAMASFLPGVDVEKGLSVLNNLKDVLAQLKQFMQLANEQNAPLLPEQIEELNTINNALQTDLDALKGLVQHETTPVKTDPLLALTKPEGLSTTTNIEGPSDESSIRSLLETDMNLIREALQKYRDNLTSSKMLFDSSKEQQSDTDLNMNITPANTRETDRFQSAIFSAVVTAGTTDQGAVQQNIPANNTLSPAAISAHTTGSNADANTGGNSGQGGSNQGQFAIGSANALTAKNAAGAASTQFSNLLNRSEQTPVSEQVAFQIKTAVGNGNSKITIQLNPHELGKLDITLKVDSDGNTGVTITADNKQTLDLLQRDSQSLQKALAEAGLKADSGSLSFNLRGGEREGQGQNQSQAASQYKKSQPEELQPEEMNIAAVASLTRSYVINLPDGLNIKI